MSRQTSGHGRRPRAPEGARRFLQHSCEHRLLQVFLGRLALYEVYVEIETGNLVCNCPGHSIRGHCKHSAFVRGSITSGGFLVVLGDDAADRNPTLEFESPEEHRCWILSNARIEVL